MIYIGDRILIKTESGEQTIEARVVRRFGAIRHIGLVLTNPIGSEKIYYFPESVVERVCRCNEQVTLVPALGVDLASLELHPVPSRGSAG